jgi:hypothetical protein
MQVHYNLAIQQFKTWFHEREEFREYEPDFSTDTMLKDFYTLSHFQNKDHTDSMYIFELEPIDHDIYVFDFCKVIMFGIKAS